MKQAHFNLDDVPPISHMQYLPEGTEMVLITGGEPMLKPRHVLDVAYQVQDHDPGIKIIVYTAGPLLSQHGYQYNLIVNWENVAKVVDGFTYTLHEPDDALAFCDMVNTGVFDPDRHSLRLNVFENVTPGDFPEKVSSDLLRWDIRWGYVWMKDCPLPKNEVFMRYQP